MSPDQPPSPLRLFAAFLRLGLTAFGGPAMIQRIAELAVKRERWLSPAAFKDGVALAQVIPGATAMQVAAYVGLRAGGPLGAAAAFVGFSLPAFCLMVGLSWTYEIGRSLPMADAVFQGVGAIVVALIAHATIGFGRAWMKCWQEAAIAAAVFAYYLSGLTPYWAVPLAALAGMVLLKGPTAEAAPSGAPMAAHTPWLAALAILAAAAVIIALLWLSGERLLAELAMTMARIDLFAFGGGFGSLPIMAHEVVEVRQWLDARAFLDGIALGQVTPGPIVITATFVGWLVAGGAGATVATVAVFLPSFLILLATTPLVDRIKHSPLVGNALHGVCASATGLIAALGVKLAEAQPWSYPSAGIGLLAFTALMMKRDPLWVILAGVALSIVLGAAG
ncbi:MAG: chromate efflux transporter [Magnetospirillum sp.]|nr:chromate efflux transporter [Magnetospirillum sp.]